MLLVEDTLGTTVTIEIGISGNMHVVWHDFACRGELFDDRLLASCEDNKNSKRSSTAQLDVSIAGGVLSGKISWISTTEHGEMFYRVYTATGYRIA